MCILIVLQTPCVMAQDESTGEEKRGFLAISLGPSIPTGQFASKDFNSSTYSGFAKTGAIFDISFGYTFTNGWGLTALARGQANTVDAQAYASGLMTQFAIDGYTVTSESWMTSGYLIGGYRSSPISERLFFDFRAMLGVMLSRLPATTIEGRDGFEAFEVSRQETNASGFATLLGVGLKYNVGRRSSLLFNVDYWGGKVDFSGFPVTTITSAFGIITDSSTSLGSIETNLNTLNLAIGYGFRF